MLDKPMIMYQYEFFKNYLLKGIMSFWEDRTKDVECGGYFTCFDKEGNLTDSKKYIWFQGRQLWSFSALFNTFGDPKWLDLARHGRDFLVKHAYAGNGRWNYQLDRSGSIEIGTNSIYSDLFVLSGLAEFALANNSSQDEKLIIDTFNSIEKNVHDLNFKDIYHNVWNSKHKKHGLYMINLIVIPIVSKVIGEEKTRSLIDHCLENILYVFAKDEHETLLEAVGRNDEYVDDDEGHITYPGHTFESCWAAIHEGRRRKDQSIIDRAIQIYDWAYKWGLDTQYGGIFSYRDITCETPKQFDWNKETNMSWDDKNFWVNAEAIAISSTAFAERKSQEYFARFEEISNWAYCHFFDQVHGEWYAELYRDGSVKLADKGTIWKAAYHVPRGILIAMQEFKNLLDDNAKD